MSTVSHPPPPRLPEVPDGVEPSAPVPRWHPGVAIGAFFATFMVAGLLSAVVLAIGGDLEDPPPAVNVAALLVQDTVIVLMAVVFASIGGRVHPVDFGLRPTRFLSAVGWTVVTYIGFFSLSAIWLVAVGADETDDLPKELGADESTLAALAIAFLVTVVAPLAEELFFRGYLFGALRGWKGLWPAALISGALFGAVHLGGSDLAYILPLAIFGFALCWLYDRTGSLYPCIVLHCINNSFALTNAMGWDWQLLLLLPAALAVIGLVLRVVRVTAGPPPAAPAPA